MTGSRTPEGRILLELTNRMSLMVLHAAFAGAIGLVMLVTGAPAPVENWFGPDIRGLVGVLPVLGAACVIAGAIRGETQDGGWWGLTTGMGLLTAWHAGLAVAYGIAAVRAPIDFVQLGEPLPAGLTDRAYIPFVYIAFTGLTGVHLRTLLNVGRPRH